MKTIFAFLLLPFLMISARNNDWYRKSSAFVGVYKAKVSDLYEEYITPQENGKRCDNYYAAFYDGEGNGLTIEGEPTFDFSALYFSIDDLTQTERGTKHTYDLKKRDRIFLNIDYKQTGVGGDNSWRAKAHPEYTLYPKKYCCSFTIKPYSD